MAKLEPNPCPQCGAPAVVENPKPRRWRVVCSKNSELLGAHRVFGHPMFTRTAAVKEWNKLQGATDAAK